MRKHWVGVGGNVLNFTADGTTLAQQVGGTGGLADAFTVLRMLGEYTVFPTSVPAAADALEFCVGIGVVSSDAATLGSTAMPDPCDEPDYPWLYWASHPLGYNSNVLNDGLGSSEVRKSFDIKSMRKIKPSESLVTVTQYANFVGNPPITIVLGGLRVLLAH